MSLNIHAAAKRYGDNISFANLDYRLGRGEKAALVGPNGSGKSSLLQVILGHLKPQQGSVIMGSGLSVFHASQHDAELQAFVTLADAILAAQPELRRQDMYSLLAQLGLPADPDFLLTDLSGGQLTRLALARLAVTRASLLVLDEPTNHLDLRMVEALESMLASYPGTISLRRMTGGWCRQWRAGYWSCAVHPEAAVLTRLF